MLHYSGNRDVKGPLKDPTPITRIIIIIIQYYSYSYYYYYYLNGRWVRVTEVRSMLPSVNKSVILFSGIINRCLLSPTYSRVRRNFCNFENNSLQCYYTWNTWHSFKYGIRIRYFIESKYVFPFYSCDVSGCNMPIPSSLNISTCEQVHGKVLHQSIDYRKGETNMVKTEDLRWPSDYSL